jgi:hypothetical protein
MSKHTPGPWQWDDGYYSLRPVAPSANVAKILEFDGCAVPRDCDIEEMRAEIEANKRLIGASPELLAELHEAMATLDCLRDFVAEGARHMVGAAEAVRSADAQINRIYRLIQKTEAA